MTPGSPSPDLRDAPDVLRRAAAGADPALVHELLTFTRCLFVLGDEGFADCPAELVQSFLRPAEGLEQDTDRRRMFARLLAIVPNPAFDVGPPAQPPERLGRRALLAEVTRRSRARRAAMRPGAAIGIERRAVPYYAAVRAALGDWSKDHDYDAPVADRVIAFLANRPPARVLDLGCGYGLILRRIQSQVPSARVIGSDAIAMGASVVAAHDHQPVRDASCDVVISTGLWEMLAEPATLAPECARTVKPDGLVVVTTVTRHVIHLTRNPLTYVEGLLSTAWPAILPPHHGLFEPLTPLDMTWQFYTRQEVRAMFAPHFEQVQVTTLHFRHLRKFGLERLAPQLPWLRHFGGQLMIVARGPRQGA